jgi:hypothetical protein
MMLEMKAGGAVKLTRMSEPEGSYWHKKIAPEFNNSGPDFYPAL